MIKTFKNSGTEDIFNGKNSKEARKVCPQSLWKIASRKLDQIDSANKIDDLKVPPGNMLEALKGDRQGEYGIRINSQYRICFIWSEHGPDQVEIIDYH
ncbi:MAG: type II toxin-antitoxin system RelE/ParE family toxin [Pseudomonadota bacterium]